MCIPIASIYVFFYRNIYHENQPNGICKKEATATSRMYQAFDALLSPDRSPVFHFSAAMATGPLDLESEDLGSQSLLHEIS